MGYSPESITSLISYLDPVSVALETQPCHHTALCGVLADEHRLRAAARLCHRGGGSDGLRGLVYSWQVDLEARPVAGLGIHPDESARLLHDPVHRRQAQPRALARLLGRKEWLEDAGLRLLVHA